MAAKKRGRRGGDRSGMRRRLRVWAGGRSGKTDEGWGFGGGGRAGFG